ncbi:MAG: cation-transporting P-type ATPase, partial [Micrococcales bacterium]|nr:cation-transporting P-type ATPase [Micrococcales bacterium]
MKITHRDSRGIVNQNDQLEQDYKAFAAGTGDDVLRAVRSTPAGLGQAEAAARLVTGGKNTTSDAKAKGWWVFALRSFADEFIIVLIVLGVVSLLMSDPLGASIIFILAVVSAIIRFVQDYTSYRSSEKLKTMLHTTVDVRRDGQLTKRNIEDVVVGDVLELGPGSVVPADLRVIECKDLFLAQSMFTGEAVPVEKKATESDLSKASTDLADVCLMGCNVVNGSAVGVVVKTGKSTYMGHIASTVETNRTATNFEVGVKKITNLLMIYMSV